MDSEPEVIKDKKKKDRSRKKQLYQAILKQMEFYFSNANLSKDRFLTQVLAANGKAELATFLTFNKIRALTTNVNDLVKALRQSEELEVDEENMTVKRVKPFVEKQNVDDCVIYVEQLPPDAEHDWLREVFSSYGEIDYVSIPKFKSGKNKGFAFVEFSNPECVQNAVEDYKKAGNYLPMEMAPETLCSVATHEDEGKAGLTEQSLFLEDKVEEAKDDGNDIQQTKKKKPKLDSAPKSQSEVVKLTKKGTSDVDEKATTDTENGGVGLGHERMIVEDKKNADNCQQSKKRKASEDSNPESQKKAKGETRNAEMENPDSENVTDSEVECNDPDKKKKRKNRRKKKKSKKDKVTAESSGLQILTKADWKRLRNKYLNIQKEKMKLLKKHLRNHQQNKRVVKVPPEKETEKLGFIRGLIVKVSVSEPVVDVKRFKDDVKMAHRGIQYIDVKEGVCEIYIRLDTPDSARNLSKNSSWESAAILEGEEEVNYWKKVSESRSELSKKKNLKERGKNKLLKKAEKALGKHIVFEELENE